MKTGDIVVLANEFWFYSSRKAEMGIEVLANELFVVLDDKPVKNNAFDTFDLKVFSFKNCSSGYLSSYAKNDFNYLLRSAK